MLIKKKIQDQLYNFKNILLAYSGGVDSTVLLYNLVELRKKYQLNIRAIHINHNLNKKSHNWMKFCFSQCKKLNVFFIYKNIYIKQKNNIEEYTRNKRYSIFKKIIKNNEILVTAHNLDEQCETFFLTLKRGSGSKGLACMSLIRKLNNFIIFRPFLNISKSLIKNYAIKKKINWIEDPSNKDIKYDRNFLRNIILPKIIKRWPYFQKTLTRSIKNYREQEKLLNNLIKPILTKLIQKDNSLFIPPLFNFNIEKRNFIIRKWIEYNKYYLMPSRKLLKIIWYEIICCKKNNNPQVKIGKYVIRKHKDYLFCLKYFPNLKNNIIKWDDIKKPLILPYNLGKIIIYNNNFYKKKIINIRKPKNNEFIYIKFNNTTQKYYFNNSRYKKNINNVWKNLNIPKWEREITPLLFYNNKLIMDLRNQLITQYGKINILEKNNFFIYFQKKY